MRRRRPEPQAAEQEWARSDEDFGINNVCVASRGRRRKQDKSIEKCQVGNFDAFTAALIPEFQKF